MNKTIKYIYNKELGRAECLIFEQGKRYRGVAKVHEDDKNTESEKVGLTIAYLKAEIDRFDKKAKSAKQKGEELQRQADHFFALAAQHEERKNLYEKELKEYIEAKEKFKNLYKNVQLKRSVIR